MPLFTDVVLQALTREGGAASLTTVAQELRYARLRTGTNAELEARLVAAGFTVTAYDRVGTGRRRVGPAEVCRYREVSL